MTVTATIDLRSRFGPSRDQGSRPTCLAFAASDAHAAQRGAWSELSCEYAFYKAQQRAGLCATDGALLPSMLLAIHHDGQPLEAGWPYSKSAPSNPKAWTPPSALGELFYRNGKPISPSIGEIRKELAAGNPVLLLMKLSSSFYKPTSDGIVHSLKAELPDPNRRHAVIAVGTGISEERELILVRNSWGPRWGVFGYAWLTEDFLTPRLFNAAKL